MKTVADKYHVPEYWAWERSKHNHSVCSDVGKTKARNLHAGWKVDVGPQGCARMLSYMAN